jgi:hypothetical protein
MVARSGDEVERFWWSGVYESQSNHFRRKLAGELAGIKSAGRLTY